MGIQPSSVYLREDIEVQRRDCRPGIEPAASQFEAGQLAVSIILSVLSSDFRQFLFAPLKTSVALGVGAAALCAGITSERRFCVFYVYL